MAPPSTSTDRPEPSPRYISLWPIAITLTLIASPFAWLYYALGQKGSPTRQEACLRNEKAIALALVQYTQDYDEHFPPARSATTLPDGTRAAVSWAGMNTITDRQGNRTPVPGLLDA